MERRQRLVAVRLVENPRHLLERLVQRVVAVVVPGVGPPEHRVAEERRDVVRQLLDVLVLETEEAVLHQPPGVDEVEVAVQLVEHLLVDAVVGDQFGHRFLVDGNAVEFRVVVGVVPVDDADGVERVAVPQCDRHVRVPREVVGDVLRDRLEGHLAGRRHLDGPLVVARRRRGPGPVGSGFVGLGRVVTAPGGASCQHPGRAGDSDRQYVASCLRSSLHTDLGQPKR